MWIYIEKAELFTTFVMTRLVDCDLSLINSFDFESFEQHVTQHDHAERLEQGKLCNCTLECNWYDPVP